MKSHKQLALSKEQIDSVMSLYSSGKIIEAIDLVKNLNKDFPNVPLLFNILGACYQALKQLDTSVKMFKTAISIKPDYAEAHFNLGVVLRILGRPKLAVESYKKAIAHFPYYLSAYNNLGNALKQIGELEEAIVSYQNAINIKPDFAEAHNNIGIVLKDLGRLSESVKSYEAAILINPEFYDAHFNLGNSLRDLNKRDQALKSYETAHDLKPDEDYIIGNILHTKMHLSIWEGLSKNLLDLVKSINNGEKVIGPFALMALVDDPIVLRKATEIYANDKFPKSHALPKIDHHPKHKKIRIGYFSADFREHPVSTLTVELYEGHNRSQFEVYAFSYGPDTKDKMNLRIKAGVDYFYDVRSMSSKDVAILSRSLEIDIGIDLGGFTQNARTDIFAMSPAPIQLSYIGYLGTMGADYYDYLIADQTIIPEESKQFYSEKIIYLPCFQANDSNQSEAVSSFTRQDLGLPSKGFIFCCFNNTYKITPLTLDSWAQILKNVEDSVLLVFASNESAKIHLTKEITLRGIDPSRLILGEHLPRPEYLGRYQVVDLFLDTHPYNAGTTSSDALRMGLPVLTYLGKSFASRMGSSILNAVNLPELITSSQEEYEKLAIRLATNPDQFKLIKDKLAKNLPSSPLFDTPLFTKHLEIAYRTMYERYHDGLKPDHIYVEHSNSSNLINEKRQ